MINNRKCLCGFIETDIPELVEFTSLQANTSEILNYEDEIEQTELDIEFKESFKRHGHQYVSLISCPRCGLVYVER